MAAAKLCEGHIVDVTVRYWVNAITQQKFYKFRRIFSTRLYIYFTRRLVSDLIRPSLGYYDEYQMCAKFDLTNKYV